jgi:hypothetical protein
MEIFIPSNQVSIIFGAQPNNSDILLFSKHQKFHFAKQKNSFYT